MPSPFDLRPIRTLQCNIPDSRAFRQAAPPEGPKEGSGLPGTLRWFGVSLACLMFSILVANGIPFFSELQALLGSLTGAPILFGWPAFFYLRSCHMRGRPVARQDYLGTNLAFTQYCYYQYCMVYSTQTGGRKGSLILSKTRAIVLHHGGQCRWERMVDSCKTAST